MVRVQLNHDICSDLQKARVKITMGNLTNTFESGYANWGRPIEMSREYGPDAL